MHFLSFVCSAHVLDWAAPEAETTCSAEKGGELRYVIGVQGSNPHRLRLKYTRNATSRREGYHGTGGSLLKNRSWMFDFPEDCGGNY